MKSWVAPASEGRKNGLGLLQLIADGELVRILHLGQLAVGNELDLRAGRAQALALRHVLPEEAEVLGREGMAVRPFVALAQAEREDAALLHVDRRQDVRDQLQRLRVADEPRIAVDVEQAHIAGAADQHPQLAAGLADLRHALDHPRLLGRLGPCLGSREAPAPLPRGAPSGTCSFVFSAPFAHEVPWFRLDQRA